MMVCATPFGDGNMPALSTLDATAAPDVPTNSRNEPKRPALYDLACLPVDPSPTADKTEASPPTCL